MVIATGAQYRQLDVAGIAEYEGVSVHYWASPLEARLCLGREVALVGGGNSAGQAAVYLAGNAQHVTVIARRPLAETMSSYLVERIAAQPNITVLDGAEVSAIEGQDGVMAAIRWRRRGSDAETELAVRHMFLFIGADPNTGWLARTGITLDSKGFILTGPKRRPNGCRSRRAARACSRSATSARDRSSASPPRQATAHEWWPRCTPIWRTAGDRDRNLADRRASAL